MIFKKAILIAAFLAFPAIAGCNTHSTQNNAVEGPVLASKNERADAPSGLYNGAVQPDPQPEILVSNQNPEPLTQQYACTNADDPTAYSVGPEDRLAIIVFGEADLSGRYTLDNKGVISMPLIGEVPLSGCTIRQAERIIKERYADGYLITPSISIEVTEFRPFYILGEVQSPGKYDFSAGMSFLKAAAIAGGFTYRADRKEAKILRYGPSGQPVYLKQPFEAAVQPGDVVTVEERFF